MISYNTLISEIEKHVKLAKSSNDNQRLREHLIAIKALCDAGLAQNKQLQSNQSISLSSSKKLEEDDANGTSIFDF